MKEKFWNFILNHKVIAIIGLLSFILGIFGILFSIYAYLKPISSESVIAYSTNSGSLNLKSNLPIENSSMLQNSIYDIINKMNKTDFTRQKIEIRDSVMGLYANDEGYLYDVNNFSLDNTDYIITDSGL